MKTLIILLLFSFTTTLSVAQTDSTSQELKSVIYNDVKVAIESIAAALKVGSEHVYAVLVKQQIVNSITFIMVYLVGIFVVLFMFKQASKLPPYDDRSDREDELHTTFIIIGSILGVIVIFFFICTISMTVTGFVNPEYGAIEKIMELLK